MPQEDLAEWEEAYEQGSPAFVEYVRQVQDPEFLEIVSRLWITDRREHTRGLLSLYLDQPLNAFRHELLVKRLFKQAEAAGDDQVLAWLAPALDRCIDRRTQFSRRSRRDIVSSQEEAQELAKKLLDTGAITTKSWQIGPDQYLVISRWSELGFAVPHGTRMPGISPRSAFVLDASEKRYVRIPLPEWAVRIGLASKLQPGVSLPHPGEFSERLARFRLFSVATRQYLRRRLWRYFEQLGENDGKRYVEAASQALIRYRDEDLYLARVLDRWILVHILFGSHPAMSSRSNGWIKSIEAIHPHFDPRPAFPEHWVDASDWLFWIAENARSYLVSKWAIALLRRNPQSWRSSLRLEMIEGLITHPDPLVSEFGASCLAELPDIDEIELSRWRVLLNGASNSTVSERISAQIEARTKSETLSTRQAVELALMFPEHLARHGLHLLQQREISVNELPEVLSVAHTDSDEIRPEALEWLKVLLGRTPGLEPDWVCDWILSSHAETRALGLSYFLASAEAHLDPRNWDQIVSGASSELWPGLIDLLARNLTRRNGAGSELVAELPLSALFPLWSNEITMVPGRSYCQEQVVAQVRRRLESHPDEAELLAELLATAFGSSFERVARAAVAGLARICSLRPDLQAVVEQSIPELQWNA